MGSFRMTYVGLAVPASRGTAGRRLRASGPLAESGIKGCRDQTDLRGQGHTLIGPRPRSLLTSHVVIG